jgi:hypothetical protein
LKEIYGKDLYLPKKFYHSAALIITAPSDREYSIALVSGWPEQSGRQPENKLKWG